MSHALTNRILLKERALMMKGVRAFFEERGVIEVDVPSLARGACIDQHIDLFELSLGGERAFLHSSPEYYMKRLLVEGMCDCYQLSHVFRHGEVSARHNPEFTMVEWYRLGFSLVEMIEETLALCALVIGVSTSALFLTYRETFTHFLGYYPETKEERDYFFAFDLDSYLEKEKGFVVIEDFPEEEAALAQVKEGCAKRFEIFYQGIELANGYLELQDGAEYRARLAKANALRTRAYPVDEAFLEAMDRGLPPCCGVAVGFDRLLMLRMGLSIKEVIPFAWT